MPRRRRLSWKEVVKALQAYDPEIEFTAKRGSGSHGFLSHAKTKKGCAIHTSKGKEPINPIVIRNIKRAFDLPDGIID